MKVLMVSKSQVVGAYHGKLREIAKLGVDLTVVTPPRWGKQRLEDVNPQGYNLRVLPCLLTGHTHFHFYLSGMRSIEADLVHLEEEPWSLVTYQFMRLCAKLKKPVIFFTWQNIYKDYPQPFRWFEQFTFVNTCAAITGNTEGEEILRQKGFDKPIRVIPQLGVDPSVFQRRDSSQLRNHLGLNQEFVVGYIGRIVEQKGIEDLIHALAFLPELCKLVLVGDGEFRRQASRLASKIGVSSRVLWIPHVSSLDVPTYISLFDVLALPSRTTSRWKEQFGRVLVEAMACEIPVVGSSSGEIPNVIGDAGLVFAEGDVGALAGCIELLCKNPDLRKQLGTRGRRRVLDKFTHKEIAQQTVELYSDVLRTPNSRECAVQLSKQ